MDRRVFSAAANVLAAAGVMLMGLAAGAHQFEHGHIVLGWVYWVMGAGISLQYLLEGWIKALGWKIVVQRRS